MTFNYSNLSCFSYIRIANLDAPRLIILNDQIQSFLHDTVNVTCQICSFPQITHVNWFRNDEYLNDINIIMKTQSIDDYQCSISTIEIVVRIHFQFLFFEIFCFVSIGYKSISIWKI